MPEKLDINLPISIFKSKKYRCPKHGYIGDANFDIRAFGDERFKNTVFDRTKKLCFYCFMDVLEKHCHELEEIKDEQ